MRHRCAAALQGDLAAVAERASVERFDGRAAVSGLDGEGHRDEAAETRSGHGYARPKVTVPVTNLQDCGGGNRYAEKG